MENQQRASNAIITYMTIYMKTLCTFIVASCAQHYFFAASGKNHLYLCKKYCDSELERMKDLHV